MERTGKGVRGAHGWELAPPPFSAAEIWRAATRASGPDGRRNRDGITWGERCHRNMRPRQGSEVQEDGLRVLNLRHPDLDRTRLWNRDRRRYEGAFGEQPGISSMSLVRPWSPSP